MAEVAFPSAGVVEALDLTQAWPGRIVHSVPATDDEVILNRGLPRWEGRVRLSMLETGTDARAVEAWLAQMSLGENFSEIPMGSRASAFTATTASAVASGTITLAALPSGLAVNTFIRSGNRLFIVTSLVSSTRQATVWPSGIIAAGDAISQAATVRARLTDPGGASPSERGFAGPWTRKFREAV